MGARELWEMGVKCSWGGGMGEPDGGDKCGQCSDREGQMGDIVPKWGEGKKHAGCHDNKIC